MLQEGMPKAGRIVRPRIRCNPSPSTSRRGERHDARCDDELLYAGGVCDVEDPGRTGDSGL